MNIQKSNHHFKIKKAIRGFTIVELLVVIVVIGILAAVTIIAYTGVSKRAIAASLSSDLSSSSTQLKMYYEEHNVYPASLDANNCPVSPSDANYCLKPSSGNVFSYSSSSPYKTFTLTATNSSTGIVYSVTESAPPIVIPPVSATGGTVTTVDGYTIHTFTTSGTLTVTNGGSVSYLVVAGGGGSAMGGGGAGGYLSGTDTVSPGSVAITVGTGGTAGGWTFSAGNGTNSVFLTHTAIGGGGGSTQCYYGGPSAGGSGGGGGSCGTGGTSGASGTAGQGFAGGGNGGFNSGSYPSGGGGGAGGIGGTAPNNTTSGIGGIGLSNSISGSAITYATGGNGSNDSGGAGSNGTNGRGDGANGGGSSGPWGVGGSGVVIIRYKS